MEPWNVVIGGLCFVILLLAVYGLHQRDKRREAEDDLLLAQRRADRLARSLPDFEFGGERLPQ